MSDHHLVLCDILMSKPSLPTTTVSFRKLSSIDNESFRKDIQNADLITNPPSDLTDLVEMYDVTLRKIINDHAPQKSRTFTQRPLVPWYNEAIRIAKCKRRKLEQIWRRTRLTVDRDMFKMQRSIVDGLIQEAKGDYYHDKIQQCAGDQKALFKVVDSLLYRKADSPLPPHT